MPTLPVIGILGLKTSGNPLAYPPGSLSKADNCIIPSRGELTPRRGQPHGTGTFGSGAAYASAMTEYDSRLVVKYTAIPSGALTISSDTSSTATFTDLSGTWEPPDPNTQRMKFAQLAQNLYWTSAVGLGVLSSASGQARAAGVAGPPVATAALSGNPDVGWMPENTAVGYRCVFGRKDLRGNVKLSAPSGLKVLINPADEVVAIGGLARTGGTTVTATVTTHNFHVGDVLALSPGEANFADGNYTVTAITSTTIVWTNAGANVVSTAEETLSSGSKNVSVSAIVPDGMGLVAGDFVQVYRTDSTEAGVFEPGDECFLAYERTLSATDISNRIVTVTDTTPESFLGNALYTNANSGEGAAFEHGLPPLMNDVCVFDGRLFGAQTTGPHAMTLRLIGVGSPNGLQAGDLLAVGEKVYVMTSYIVDDYLPTRNIADTVDAFSIAVSQEASGELTAMPTATDSLPVGGIYLSRRNVTDGVFYAATSRASAWQDYLPEIVAVTEASTSRTGSTVTVTTSASHNLTTGNSIVLAYQAGTTEDANFPGGVKTSITVTGATTFTYTEAGAVATMTGTYYVFFAANPATGQGALGYGSTQLKKQVRFTQPGQPEAWPISNALGGLPSNEEVLRIAALRGQLFIFFQYGDIYTCSGSYPYTTSKYNGSATLVAPDTLIEHAESLYCLTTQGIVSISEAGLKVVSRDVEDALRTVIIRGSTLLATAFAVSYDMDRQYQCWVSATGSQPSEAYVYHSDSGLFTRWEAGRTCGLAIKNTPSGLYGEQLVFGSTTANKLRFENKALTQADLYDDTLTFTGVSGTSGLSTAVRASGWSGVTVGDYITAAEMSSAAWVTAINGTALTFSPATWSSSPVSTTATIKVGIRPLVFGWVANPGGAPGLEKQWREMQLHFSKQSFKEIVISAFGERQNTSQTVTATLSPATLEPGLTGSVTLSTIRAGVPMDAQREAWLEVRVDADNYAYQDFRLLGASLTADGATERTPK